MNNKKYKQIKLLRDDTCNLLFDGINGDLYINDYETNEKLKVFMDMDYYNIEKPEEFCNILNKMGVYSTNEDFKNIYDFIHNRNDISSNIGAIYKQMNLKEEFSSISLNISEKCNFNCSYCFGDGGNYGRVEHFMNWGVAKTLIDFWLENLNKNSLVYNVNFFGGEPFLNLDIIKKTVSYLNSKEYLHNKVHFIVTTNGSIFNEEIRDILNENNFEISISIDGLPFIHNKNRPYKNNLKSFDTVFQNIDSFKSCAKDLSIQMTLTNKDITYMSDSVRFLWNNDIEKVYSNLVFGKNIDYSSEDIRNYDSELNKLKNMTLDNLKKGKNNIYGNILSGAKNIYTKKFSLNCFARRKHGLISSANGEIYSCYRAIGMREFFVKDLEKLNSPRSQVIDYKVKECDECYVQLFCGNGCPYENLISTGDLCKASENLCWKTIVDFDYSLLLLAKLLEMNLEAVLGV